MDQYSDTLAGTLVCAPGSEETLQRLILRDVETIPDHRGHRTVVQQYEQVERNH